MYILITAKKSFLESYLNLAIDRGFESIDSIKKEAMRIYKERGHEPIDFLSKQEVYSEYFV